MAKLAVEVLENLKIMKTRPSNYCTDVIQQLNNPRENKFYNHKYCGFVKNVINAGTKYYIDEKTEALMVDTFDFEVIKHVRMPHPITVLEVDGGEMDLIVLVLDYYYEDCEKFKLSFEEQSELVICFLARHKNPNFLWSMESYVIAIGNLNVSSLDECVRYSVEIEGLNHYQKESYKNKATSYEEVRDENSKVVSRYVLDFLTLISCDNIRITNTKPKKFLNAKRLRKGKCPYFEYKVLNLQSHVPDKNFTDGRASPRLHVRRGHIRHYEQKNIWIDPMIIGDRNNGTIIKDYKL